jgi:rRNA maturation protein Nop10
MNKTITKEKCSDCGNTTEVMHSASQWLNIRKQNKYYFTLCDNCCACYGSGNCEPKPRNLK